MNRSNKTWWIVCPPANLWLNITNLSNVIHTTILCERYCVQSGLSGSQAIVDGHEGDVLYLVGIKWDTPSLGSGQPLNSEMNCKQLDLTTARNG